MVDLETGIRRITFPMPLGLDHVHCYLLPAEGGGWTVVDTGLGLPDAAERWRRIVEQLDEPVVRIVITHFHPDHVGAAADLGGLTGAPVFQGADDYAQCLRTWGELRVEERMPKYLQLHGAPREDVESFRTEATAFVRLVRFARDPEPLSAGDEVDGWVVLHLPGHADGHLALLRDGILVAGDTLLGSISPNIGLYPDSRPDPLGDYLTSLNRIAELGPRVAFPGHGEPIGDPAGRARELIAHHQERLEQTAAALDGRPQTAYDVSLKLFPEPLSTTLRRFALAETRAHIEYLVKRDKARLVEEPDRISYLGTTRE
ncbi:MAG TPA: MBL fold metallo-hydrolase [Gaiellaceae bacterium]|nr:MBL fold metallo-hydrolase [Gaiellaceae bacterium]